MKSRFAVVAACAAIVAGTVGIPVASAAASPLARTQSVRLTATHSTAASHATRKFRHRYTPRPLSVSGTTVYYCKFRANEPFWLIHESSRLYATGSIFECSSPPPTGCHMTTDLQELKDQGGIKLWTTIATGDKGWRTCTTRRPNNTTTASYKCQSTLHYQQFRTVVYLSIEYPGGHATGNPAISSSVTKRCE
jgi:hypothetical protein